MNTIQVGIVGGGTVGTGILRICQTHQKDIEERLGASLEIRTVAVRNLQRERHPAFAQVRLTDQVSDIMEDPQIQVVVEVMGGVDEAFDVVEQALLAKKHVVTANKALLAERGLELFELASVQGVDLAFEASVGGGIPIMRSIREALASDQILRLAGIINGTSNYILTAMSHGANDIGEVVKEAQNKGYAEANPSMDVDGVDAAQKLSLLTSLAFGTQIPYGAIPTQGLMDLCAVDFALAKHFGFVLKPLALASRSADGVYASVTPALVSESALMGSVNGAFNAVYMEGSALGPSLLYGQGAGMLPTAVSVVSDMIEVGRNILQGSHGRLPLPTPLKSSGLQQLTTIESPCFVRLQVEDTPGVLAQISGALGDAGIGIRQMIQTVGEQQGEAVIGLTTYPADREVLGGVLEGLKEEEGPVRDVLALPILDLD